MQISQEVQNEIDENLRLQTELLEVINNAKANKHIAELDDSCKDIIRLKIETSEYTCEDLIYYVTTSLSKKIITKKESDIIKEAIISTNDDAFYSDSEELQSLIICVYNEIEHLNTEEINSYLKSVETELDNDKYKLYIYERAFFNRDIVLK